jgi:hypothetical protein
MADTNHPHSHAHAHSHSDLQPHEAGIPVQPDGVNFAGVFWSVAIMFIVTIVSQVLMVGAFKWLDAQVKAADTARAPLSAPQGQLPPAPNLLYELSGSKQQNEPGDLAQFREYERAKLHEYAVDQAAGTARIPVDRAKELILERGVLVGPPAVTAVPAQPTPAAPAPSAPQAPATPTPTPGKAH